MPNLVGIGNSQVPTNAMLGGLAYQDPSHAILKNVEPGNIAAINTRIDRTATQSGVYVYNTNEDSDGGQWRYRCQDKSWYNEQLGTRWRGHRKEFPSIAVIVCQSYHLYIYDGDDPNLPMWMGFKPGVGGSASDSTFLGAGGQGAIRGVAMKNGILCVAYTTSGWGISRIDFLADSQKWYWTSGQYSQPDGHISMRNVEQTYVQFGGNKHSALASNHSYVNDVDMTVLPDAPIGKDSGIQVPTIAITSTGGITIIHDDEGNSNSSTGTKDGQYVVFTEDHKILVNEFVNYSPADEVHLLDVAVDGEGTNLSDLRAYGMNDNGEDVVTSNKFTNGGWSNGLAAGNNYVYGVNYHDGNNPHPALGMIARSKDGISDEMVNFMEWDYCSGWQPGYCKTSTCASLRLHDSYQGGYTNLISDPFYSGDGSDLSSWTARNAVVTVDSNRLKVDDSANAGSWSSAQQSFTTVANQEYVASAKFTAGSPTQAFLFGFYNGGVASAGTAPTWNQNFGTSNGTYKFRFKAAGTTTTLVLAMNDNGVGYFEEIYVKKAVQERSIKRTQATDTGNTAGGWHPVGAMSVRELERDADLDAYGGFSSSNYIMSPSNSDMNYGTGDFYITGWWTMNDTTPSSDNDFFTRCDNGPTKAIFVQHRVNNTLRIYTSDSSGATYTDSGTISNTEGAWCHFFANRNSGGIDLYINGVLDNSSKTNNGAKDIGSNLNAYIGGRIQTSQNYANDAKVSLIRTGSGNLSAKQIERMYITEKALFGRGAKTGLAGTSRDGRTIAYDRTRDILHVSTTTTKSEFAGLVRINSEDRGYLIRMSVSDGFFAGQ